MMGKYGVVWKYRVIGKYGGVWKYWVMGKYGGVSKYRVQIWEWVIMVVMSA